MEDAIPQLRRLFDWDHWANRATLESLGTVPVLPAKTLKLMSHLVASQQLWLSRLREGENRDLPVWPEWTAEEIEARLGRLEQDWRGLLDGMAPAQLKERGAYINSKGEHWENAIGDMLLHVILHGAYHRGQIAADVRAAGGEPAYTDFIEAVRKGFVK